MSDGVAADPSSPKSPAKIPPPPISPIKISPKPSPRQSPKTSPKTPKRRSTSPRVTPTGSSNKRQRRQTQHFTADLLTESAKKPRSEPKPEKELRFEKGEYLAIRAEGGIFYLGQARQNVFAHTETCRIRWLEIEKPPQIYKVAYDDSVEVATIIGTVSISTAARGLLRLNDGEEDRIKTLLQAAIDGRDAFSLSKELFEPQARKRKIPPEKEADPKPTLKKPKIAAKKIKKGRSTKNGPTKMTNGKKSGSTNNKKPVSKRQGQFKKQSSGNRKALLNAAASLKKKPSLLKKTSSLTRMASLVKKSSLKRVASVKAGIKGRVKPPGRVRDPNRSLKPNPAVKVWEKDPLFEMREEVPFISTVHHSHLALRAVNLGDKKLLQRVINDEKQVHSLHQDRSMNNPITPLRAALLKEDHATLKLLTDQIYNYSSRKSRAAKPSSMLQPEGTGRYNPRSLGIKKIRKINLSRGGKEGNNALTKDLEYKQDEEDDFAYAVQHNVALDTILLLQAASNASDYQLQNYIYLAVRAGHRKLAAQLITRSEKIGGGGFNFVHKNVLEWDGRQDWSEPVREASAKKKPLENKTVLPVHCAAINPSVKYLSKLLSVAPDFNIEDADKRRPIHYAAACTGTGPLQFLIDKGVSIEEGDVNGLTPLIIACQTGRKHNVEVLLKKAEADSKKQLDSGLISEKVLKKFGVGGVNKPLKNSWCPIHYAVINRHQEIVEILLKYGADPNKQMNATCEKLTPLMIATQNADLPMVRFLCNSMAKIEQVDKFKRTALIHAARDGSAHILSYLLSRGSNPDAADSSGNTVLHYAAAYGWYFCTRALLDAGAKPDEPNDWKLTPVAAAYMKGHQGLAQILMDVPGVNINFQDDNGYTLLMNTVRTSSLTPDTFTQVEMLVKEKKADVKLKDRNGFSALYHVAVIGLPSVTMYGLQQMDDAMKKHVEQSRKNRSDAVEIAVKIAELLMEEGGDDLLDDELFENIFERAMYSMNEDARNYKLLRIFLDKKKSFPKFKQHGENLLERLITRNLIHKESKDLLEYMCGMTLADGTKGVDEFKKLAAEQKKSDHCTPFMTACSTYCSMAHNNPPYHTAFSSFGSSYLNTAFSSSSSTCPESPQEVPDTFLEARKTLQFFIETLESKLEYKWEEELPGGKKREGQISALHFVVSAHHEPPDVDGQELPCFKMLLKYKANVDLPLADGLTLLAKYVVERNFRMVNALLAAGADVNYKCTPQNDWTLQNEKTPLLLLLARCGNHISDPNVERMVQLLIENKADVNAVDSKDITNCLHLLAEKQKSKGNLSLMKLLIGAGANINLKSKMCMTPLHIVARISTDNADESMEEEQLLIKRGADMFAKDDSDRLPLHHLFLDRSGSTVTCDPVESYSIFASAMKYKQLDCADKCGKTPLFYAASSGATVCCMLLVQKGCNINHRDSAGNTPLSEAVRRNHNSCVLTLMQKGADINGDIITNVNADVPPKATNDEEKEEEETVDDDTLYYDVYEDEDELMEDEDTKRKKQVANIARQLCRLKKKPAWKWASRHYPKPWKPGKKGHPIFQGIVMNGWQGLTFIAMDLLEPFGMDYAAAVEIALSIRKFRFALTLINKQMDDSKLLVTNKKKQNLLHILASSASATDDWDLIKQILDELIDERKLDYNTQDEDGFTPLQYALRRRSSFNLINYLLDRPGINVTAKDKYERSTIAAFLWDPSEDTTVLDVLERLVSAGADVNALVDYPSLDTMLGGCLPHIDAEDYTQTYAHRFTTLANAVGHRQARLAQKLITCKADISVKSSEGVTPLVYAVHLNDVGLVRTLLSERGMFDYGSYRQQQQQLTKELQQGTIPRLIPTETDPFNGVGQLPSERHVTAAPISPSKSALSIVDNHGFSIMHHAVCSLPLGCYTSMEILKVLADAGAPLDIKDKHGLTPLDHALRRGAHLVACGFQKLQEKPTESWEKPKYRPFHVDDGILWEGDPVDFRPDAAEQIKKMEEEEQRKVLPPTPDDRTNMPRSVVVTDKEQDIPYDLLMTKVDVKIGEYGLYNFYKMQVLHDPEKDMHVLFNCWGRIGDRGQFQKTPFGTQEEAISEFCKVFKSKSGNEWSNVKNFEIQPKKYRLVDADQRRRNKVPDVHFKLESELPSKLPPYVQDMVKELSSVSMLRNMVEKQGVDIPFGRLKREHIVKARDLLLKLLPLADRKATIQNCLTTDTIDEYREVMEKIWELSSEYFYLVPQRGLAYESLRPIDSDYEIKEKLECLTQLLELEYAGQILLGAQFRSSEINPLDYVYRAMKIKLRLLDRGDDIVKLIMAYVFKTAGNYQDIEAIYSVSRDGEDERLSACKVDNHRLLWHGSSTSNLISILSRGLLVAPKEAPTTGYAFGKGIYTADTFSKSMNYSRNDRGGQSRYMLLCEVALGKMYPVSNSTYMESPPEGYNSTHAQAAQVPDPAFDAALPYGVTIPLGELVESREPLEEATDSHGTKYKVQRYLHSNEYIVYDESQVALRYVVQFR